MATDTQQMAPAGRLRRARLSRRESRQWPATDSSTGTTFVHSPHSTCATDSVTRGPCGNRTRV